MIDAALRKTDGRKKDAAELLGWGRNTLTVRCKNYGAKQCIVLYEPEIPQNTGNIIRLCANVVHRASDRATGLCARDDKRLRRRFGLPRICPGNHPPIWQPANNTLTKVDGWL